MKNGELVRYGGRWVKIVRDGKCYLHELGSHLTLIPVVRPRKFGFWYRLWLTWCPEFWRRCKRRKSHQDFCRRVGIAYQNFGSDEHIAKEKARVSLLPPTEYIGLAPSPKTKSQSQLDLHRIIVEAVNQHRK